MSESDDGNKSIPLASLSPEDAERFRRARLKELWLARHQVRNWCQSAALCTAAIVGDGPDVTTEVVMAFWIRIYGVMYDVREEFTQAGESGRAAPAAASLVVGAIEEFFKSISDNELAFLNVYRHRHAHPIQKKYRMRIRDGAIALHRKRLLEQDRSWTYEEERAAFNEVVAPYVDVVTGYTDDVGIARHYAVRFCPLFTPLLRALDAFYSQNPFHC